MTKVTVTRKRQTTIPAELKAKHHIEKESRLDVIDAGNGMMFRPRRSFLDLAGSGAERASVAEMKHLLDKLRKEDA
jgi:bifunctional DNA-binding transcriptional regulator/antitoxin component of YhaV-PrlF toxin-antitoxin module